MPRIEVDLPTPDGPCHATLHVPADGLPAPAAILFPDAAGPRETFRAVADRLAATGYAVLLPDVYHRLGDWRPFDAETVFSDPPERTGIETGITVNVQPGASVTSTSALPASTGIFVGDGTVNNFNIVTVAGAHGIGVFGINNITVHNSGGINFDNSASDHGDIGIFTLGTANVTNTNGKIRGNAAGVQGAIVNVANVGGDIQANGTNGVAILAGTSATVANQGGLIAANGQNGVAISGQTVNVTGNTGAIQAGIGVGITGGVAISAAGAGGTADVTNSGTIQASGIAIVTDGLLTLNNTGSVTSGGRFAVVSNNGDVNVNYRQCRHDRSNRWRWKCQRHQRSPNRHGQ